MAGGVPGGPPGDRRLGGVDAAHSLAGAATGGDAGEGWVDSRGQRVSFACLDSTGWMEGLRSYIGRASRDGVPDTAANGEGRWGGLPLAGILRSAERSSVAIVLPLFFFFGFFYLNINGCHACHSIVFLFDRRHPTVDAAQSLIPCLFDSQDLFFSKIKEDSQDFGNKLICNTSMK